MAARIGITGWLVLSCVVELVAAQPTAHAAEKPTETSPMRMFLGVEITPFNVFYLVRKDVNVRAKPTQRSKKIGRLDAGTRISGVGRANRDWIAYQEQGEDIGFVYEPVLYPVIESALDADISGSLSDAGRPVCDFKISYVGKTEAEGQLFKIGDYEVDWICQADDVRAFFSTPMFLTEGPYISSQPTVHQITIDILDLAVNIEEVLSTHLLYDHEKRMLTFAGITPKRLATSIADISVPAQSVAEALRGSVRIAYGAWSDVLWRELMKRRL